jgi:hypothetical protein
MKPIDLKELPDHTYYGEATDNEKFLISRINELIEEVEQLTIKLGQLERKDRPLKK